MKLAPPRTLSLPALSCSFLLSLLVGAAACGEEAALPSGTAGTPSTGGGAVNPMGGSSSGTSPDVTAGTSAQPTAGTASGPTGGTGPSAGTGPTAGTGPSAGTGPTAGTGGAPPTGGTGPTAGTASGGTTGGDLKETVAGPLNGAMFLGKCETDNNKTVCHTPKPGEACPPNNDPATGGKLTTDKTITLGGDPAKVYTITLHVQGEVEAKDYANGMDQNNNAAHPKMDGFYSGGAPRPGTYNVYMARVSAPKKDYFFNSILPPGVSDHTTYLIDYTAQIKANGGASIRLVASDSNCDMIKNCGPTPNGTQLCAQPLVMSNVDPVAISKNPDFNFNTAYNGQWIVMVVTNVTAD